MGHSVERAGLIADMRIQSLDAQFSIGLHWFAGAENGDRTRIISLEG